MGSSAFLRTTLATALGAFLALVLFSYLTGNGTKALAALGKLFGGVEKYGTFSPTDLSRINEPSDALYEFPMQTNNARRPARVNNRTLPAVYPTSGAPSVLPSAPLSATTRPGFPEAAAYEPNIWSDVSPGSASFEGALLSDLLPSATAPPVRSLQDTFAQQFAGRVSRVPVDS